MSPAGRLASPRFVEEVPDKRLEGVMCWAFQWVIPGAGRSDGRVGQAVLQADLGRPFKISKIRPQLGY
ncbi:hypothetical protein O3P69_014954 [Scylla paramamosain]|uniref:Uncharacterized protein n=1 Tax=Scylla paramamosain TaxID=85552 RepID=A0AAW0SGE1_SCYPA